MESQSPSTLAVAPFGHFDDDKREFVLTNWQPPRPWRNILFNRTFNIQPVQTGAGVAYRHDADGTNIMINWQGQQAFYLVDLDTGEYFSLGGPTGRQAPPDAFESRYGLGYQVIRQENLELTATLTMTVPTEGDVCIYRLQVANSSQRPRRLRLVAFTDIDLNVKDPYHGSRNRFQCHISPDRRVLDINNASYLANRVWQAYLGSSLPLDCVAFEREELIGVYGTLANPQSLLVNWAGDQSPPEHPAMIGAVTLTLLAGQSTRWQLALGVTRELSELPAVAHRWTDPAQFDTAMQQVAAQMDERYGVLAVETPDEDFNRFGNIWLQHQLAYNAYWNRGWGKGFRDGMQDAWAYLLIEPQHARHMITTALPHQFADGRTVRSFAPIDAKPYNDGGVWLALAVWAYVCETGDVEFLTQHRAAFFQSQDEGTVMEHIFRAMKYLAENGGSHGLCLMPYGDWNDQLTGPGRGGKGESVWTSMAMAAALPRVAELAGLADQPEMVKQCQQWHTQCVDALQQHGWNGQWFSRAFDDEGRPLGHPDNTAGRIYILPQAWAILADVATPEQRDLALAACRKHLLVEHGFKLLGPSYREFDPSVGTLSATNPGHVENGSNYCHASTFMMNALCRCGQVDEALDLLHRLLPVNPANPPARSRQEPFSVTNSYYGPDSGAMSGRSYFSWRTGAAGWMLRTMIEGIMGVQATIDELHIAGRLPSGWNHATLRRRYRGQSITIRFTRTGTASIAVDGKPVAGSVITPQQLHSGSIIDVQLR